MINFNTRTKTSFGISIGTGLMLESIFKPTQPRYDEERVIPNIVNLKDYHFHFYNLLTLARNICTSFENKLDSSVYYNDRNFFNILLEELIMINYLYSESNCKPIYYLPNYIALKNRLNKGKERSETSPVMFFTKLYNRLNDKGFKELLTKNGIDFVFNNEILPKLRPSEKGLLTTSFMIDTFSKSNLELLDSHTGILYKKEKFYMKYDRIGNKDMSVFPHNENLLYLIGDKSMSLITSALVRTRLHLLASSNAWDHKVNEYTIIRGLKTIPEIYKMLSNYKKLYL